MTFKYRYVEKINEFPFVYNGGDWRNWYEADEKYLLALMRSFEAEVVDIEISGIIYRWTHTKNRYEFKPLYVQPKKNSPEA